MFYHTTHHAIEMTVKGPSEIVPHAKYTHGKPFSVVFLERADGGRGSVAILHMGYPVYSTSADNALCDVAECLAAKLGIC